MSVASEMPVTPCNPTFSYAHAKHAHRRNLPYFQASALSVRRQKGLARSRLFRDAIQPSDEAPHLTRAQLVPALRQAGTIRDPPRADHLRHAGRLLVRLLLCADRALPGYATIYTMAPVFSLALDRDLNEDLALSYPEPYKELINVRFSS